MKANSKFRHPMFIIVLGALFLYELWVIYRNAQTYLSFDSQWYSLPSAMQTTLIVALAASAFTIIGLIALFMLKKVGLIFLLIGILLGLYGYIGGSMSIGTRALPVVESIIKFLAVWYAVKAGPANEEAIGQLE